MNIILWLYCLWNRFYSVVLPIYSGLAKCIVLGRLLTQAKAARLSDTMKTLSIWLGKFIWCWDK